MTTAQNSKVQKRSPKKLQRTLETKLRNYSIAASGMASIAGLMFASPANAEVVATKANQVLMGPINVYQIDLNNDGTIDLKLFVSNRTSYLGCGAWLYAADMGAYGAQSGNEVVVNEKGAAVPGKHGQIVGSSDHFAHSARLNSAAGGGNSTQSNRESNGPWLKMYNRFLGVKFQINGEIHYGWLRLNVPSPGSGTLTGYAYETVPNKPIMAGFKQNDATPSSLKPNGKLTPQIHKVVPLGLGALSAGASGLQR